MLLAVTEVQQVPRQLGQRLPRQRPRDPACPRLLPRGARPAATWRAVRIRRAAREGPQTAPNFQVQCIKIVRNVRFAWDTC